MMHVLKNPPSLTLSQFHLSVLSSSFYCMHVILILKFNPRMLIRGIYVRYVAATLGSRFERLETLQNQGKVGLALHNPLSWQRRNFQTEVMN